MSVTAVPIWNHLRARFMNRAKIGTCLRPGNRPGFPGLKKISKKLT
jgi:hypothetical protein